MYFNPQRDALNLELLLWNKAPSDYVLHHAGASGRTEQRNPSGWDGGKEQRILKVEHTLTKAW